MQLTKLTVSDIITDYREYKKIFLGRQKGSHHSGKKQYKQKKSQDAKKEEPRHPVWDRRDYGGDIMCQRTLMAEKWGY